MSIGFRLSTKCKSISSFQESLDAVAARNSLSVSHTEDYSELTVCRLGNIFFNYEPADDEVEVVGDCQTNLLGAGFHKAAIELADELIEQSKLPFEVEDETEYYEHRDFEKMRSEHFYKWLNAIIDLCRDRMKEDYSMFAVCWDFNKYMPRDIDGTVVTPFGRFRPKHFAERIEKEGIEVLADEFFMWNNVDRDASFYRNTALNAMWEDCYFMPSVRSDEDAEINTFILENLEKAAAMDASLPFPKEDYLMLCLLADKSPIDVSALPDYVCEFPIGYRKDKVKYTLGNLKFVIPGEYLYFDDEGSHGYYDGRDEGWHVVRVSAYAMSEDNIEYLDGGEGKLMQEKFFDNGKCRLYDLGETKGDDSDEYVCQCQVITERQFSLFTFSCQEQEETRRLSTDFLEHLSATKDGKYDKLLQKIEQWNADDKEQEIVDAILDIPEEERTAELTGLLARAYNNQEKYKEAIETLLTIKEESQEDALWFYRMGYAYYHMNKLEDALEAFERSLELNPDDEDVQEFVDWCKNGVSPYNPDMYEEEEINTLETHIEKCFGSFENVFHEIASPDIHVDIYIVEPTPERNYYTLVTLGMGAHRMNVPAELAEYKLERAEMMIYLPPNWKINDGNEENYWPLRWLKILARLPLQQDTWLGWGHTVPNGEPFADNTKLSGVMLVNPENVEDGASVCQLPNGEEVNFYLVIPLYEEEMNYKIANHAEALLGKMDKVSPVVDIKRRNTCRGFKLPK